MEIPSQEYQYKAKQDSYKVWFALYANTVLKLSKVDASIPSACLLQFSIEYQRRCIYLSFTYKLRSRFHDNCYNRNRRCYLAAA